MDDVVVADYVRQEGIDVADRVAHYSTAFRRRTDIENLLQI